MSRLRILIADDQEKEIETARDALIAAQHEVHVATSFAKAKDLAEANQYDIAVIDRSWYTDQGLGDDEAIAYKGWELADAVRAQSPEALMILYTVHANEPLTIQQAEKRGMILVKKSFGSDARENLAQTAVGLAVQVYERTRAIHPDPPPSAFICYAREDQDFALRLAARLKERDADIWIDQKELDGGDDWPAKIDHEIRAHRNFVMVLSPDSVASDQVLRELGVAEGESKRIVPILYRPCDVPRDLHRLHRLSVSDDDLSDEGAIREILKAIQ